MSTAIHVLQPSSILCSKHVPHTTIVLFGPQDYFFLLFLYGTTNSVLRGRSIIYSAVPLLVSSWNPFDRKTLIHFIIIRFQEPAVSP